MIVKSRKLYPQSTEKRQKENDESSSSVNELKEIHHPDHITDNEQMMIIEENKVPLEAS